MILKSIYLQHFRNYSERKFDFSPDMTVVIGPNTAGKTNLSESIFTLLTGKSFRADEDTNMIAFGQEIARVQGLLEGNEEKLKLEVVIASAQATGTRQSKKHLINGIPKGRNSLQGVLPVVLFRPEELDIIIDGPSLRRSFLDAVLEQADKAYPVAKRTYDRALRQRNALLRIAKETGKRNIEQLIYWDDLLITNGQILTQKRQEFLAFINSSSHDLFSLTTVYDHSMISADRLEQYKDAEIGAGVTLVGPHRDDFIVMMVPSTPARNALHSDAGGTLREEKDIKDFGSRGQQRLAILQLKMLQISFLEKALQKKPLLILDDIFSELDTGHIQLVLEKVKGSQVILTTTHREFIPEELKKGRLIELPSPMTG